MKVKCPECTHRFDIEANEYDEGDFLSCPECNLEMTVELEEGKIKVRNAREKELEEDTEFDQYYED